MINQEIYCRYYYIVIEGQPVYYNGKKAIFSSPKEAQKCLEEYMQYTYIYDFNEHQVGTAKAYPIDLTKDSIVNHTPMRKLEPTEFYKHKWDEVDLDNWW